MTQVRFDDGGIEVDARLIGKALGMGPELVQAGLREGSITSLCERGIDEDAGSYRLSFYTRHRRLRLVVDEGGEIVRSSTVGSKDRPLPASFRKPGA